MADSAASSLEKIYYDELTWPEVNEAVAARKVVLLPIGSTEQHGHHLPLDTDNFLARSVCIKAAQQAPTELLVMPTIPYGYNEHALDFPGTIHVHYDHFIEYCLDVCKSVVYAGFDRIVLIDGHGSNEHLCEFIARRATLETDALVASTLWVRLATEAFERVRESGLGGASHACELETSAYLYLDEARVQMDKAVNHVGGAAGHPSSRFLFSDISKGGGPMKMVRWTSTDDADRGQRCGRARHGGEGRGRGGAGGLEPARLRPRVPGDGQGRARRSPRRAADAPNPPEHGLTLAGHRRGRGSPPAVAGRPRGGGRDTRRPARRDHHRRRPHRDRRGLRATRTSAARSSRRRGRRHGGTDCARSCSGRTHWTSRATGG